MNSFTKRVIPARKIYRFKIRKRVVADYLEIKKANSRQVIKILIVVMLFLSILKYLDINLVLQDLN